MPFESHTSRPKGKDLPHTAIRSGTPAEYAEVSVVWVGDTEFVHPPPRFDELIDRTLRTRRKETIVIHDDHAVDWQSFMRKLKRISDRPVEIKIYISKTYLIWSLDFGRIIEHTFNGMIPIETGARFGYFR